MHDRRIRPELDALPSRLHLLPLDDRGYPVPWFVAWVDGKPEFRAMDMEKRIRAVQERRCWVCGQPLGKWLTFVIGPMCGINRIAPEPPSHYECATWSARNCPFLSRPHMVRREDEQINHDTLQANAPGVAILRNPGVTLLWTTFSYTVVPDGRGGWLIQVGNPQRTEFWAQGRRATRAEVEESVRTGLPLLRDAARQERTEADRQAALAEIDRRLSYLVSLYPAA